MLTYLYISLCTLFRLHHTYFRCVYTLIYSDVQASTRCSAGCVCLDLNLLKPSRIEFLQDPARPLTVSDGQASSPNWLEYVYRTAHPALRWLPTKLAEWIGENMQDELGFADKADKRAAHGAGWTPAELNNILQAHVVDGGLTTFGCVEWESELFRGTMRARCYPFDMPKRRFHSFNPKVCHSVIYTSYLYIPCIYHIHQGTLQYILCLSWYITE